jgi:hypothetical protein
MKIFRRMLYLFLLAGIGVLSFYYFGVYSEGVRSGVVVKISRKGYVFKTYEGQLNLMTFGAVRSQNLVSESFEFSVSSDKTALIKELENASLSGERVSLKYIERFAIFPWRGDTKYFVTEMTHKP